MSGVILFDLDGTLANLSHRLPWIEKRPKNWKEFFANVRYDEPIQDNIDLCNYLNQRYRTIIFSGRSEICRNDTVDWLSEHKVMYTALYMRPKWDHRADYLTKYDMMCRHFPNKSEILYVFDDRDQVVKMWRDNGIRCYQVAYGNF